MASKLAKVKDHAPDCALVDAALDKIITRLDDDPHGHLFDTAWDFADGLDARTINKLVKHLSHGPVFEFEESKDKSSRVLTVHNFDSTQQPMKWTVWSTNDGPVADYYRDGHAAAKREPKLQRTLVWLRSWMAASGEEKAKPDELSAAIERAGLIGKEAMVLKLIAQHNGKVKIADAAHSAEADALSAFKRAKPKLKKQGWHLFQDDNQLCAERNSAKGRK